MKTALRDFDQNDEISSTQLIPIMVRIMVDMGRNTMANKIKQDRLPEEILSRLHNMGLNKRRTDQYLLYCYKALVANAYNIYQFIK